MEFETLLAKGFDETNGKIPDYALLHTHLRYVKSAGEAIYLPEDEKVCLQDRKQIINKSIPMTYKKQMVSWRELKGNLIAPPNTIAYCK